MLLRSALPSDSSFVRFFEELCDPALVIDPTNGEILVANRAAIALLGYSPEELGRLTPSDIHPHELPRLDAFLAAVRAHGRWTGDDRNTLATAQLVADGLAEHSDQRVGRRAEAITRSIERAVSMSRTTLRIGRAQEPPPERQRFCLADAVEDVEAAIGPEECAEEAIGASRGSASVLF